MRFVDSSYQVRVGDHQAQSSTVVFVVAGLPSFLPERDSAGLHSGTLPCDDSFIVIKMVNNVTSLR